MQNKIRAIETLTFDSAQLTGGYDPFDDAGLPEACVIVRLVNASNVAVGVSFNGIFTSDFLPAGDSIQYNFQANSQPNNQAAIMAKGTNVCLIGAAGIGDIYLIGYYQR
jgi:hypothetical protein